MRWMALAALISTALAAIAAPAEAATWRGYISHPLGFAIAAPGELKMEKGTYTSAIAGQRESVAYKFVDDNIEYKATIIDMRDRAKDAANLLGEAEFAFQDKQKVLMDTFGRVDRQYGRKFSIDLPNNGGRAMSGFYFIFGRILWLQATVLPANGDYETPEMARFVDSVTFFPVRAADDAIELPLAK